MNGYEPLPYEPDDELLCGDCSAWCSFRTVTPDGCQVDWCRCERPECIAARRARELDDRPDAALANIARDIEAENRPSVEDLMVERFGPKPRAA